MKKTYTTIIKVILVILFNLFFIVAIRFVPHSTSADIELLASVISAATPSGTYLDKVNVGKSIVSMSSGDLDKTVCGLGIFTVPVARIAPVARTDRLAASEALTAKKSSH